MNNQKIILSSIIFFTLISFVYLSYIEKKDHTLDGQWFAYFENSKDNSNTFSIENHTSTKNITWESSCNGATIQKNELNISGKETITPNDTCQGKYSLKISLKNKSLTIYKNL